MRGTVTLVALLALVAASSAAAGVIFEDDFETLHERWTENVNGEATIEIVDGGVEGKCLKVTSQGGLGYLTTTLDPEQYAGTTVEVTAMVKLVDCKVGSEMWATPKFHIAEIYEKPRPVKNHADRWVGTFDWTEKRLVAQLDDEVIRIVLDIGIQNGTGTAYYDNLVVKDTFGTGRPVSLLPVANLGRSDGVAGDGRGSFLDLGLNDLYALPEGNLETETVTFYIPKHGVNSGRTCVILKGEQRPDFPENTEAVPVGKTVGSLHFLHAAAWAEAGEKKPCVTYQIAYADGETATVEMQAGVHLGSFDDPREIEGGKIAWQGINGAGKQACAYMTEWKNPRPDVEVASLTISSAGNAVPIVLAVTYLKAR